MLSPSSLATAKESTQGMMDDETMNNNVELEKEPDETREGLLLLAQFAMKSKDYLYMLGYVKKLIQIVMPTEDISENERNCFSSACELFVDAHLNSWRHLAFVAADETASCGRREAAREYQELIAEEISKTCEDIVEFIDRSLLFRGEEASAKVMTTESRVFYKKMKGDYLGHVAMVKKGLERVKSVDAVFKLYNATMEEAMELPETNLTRLRLSLNLAVFHAEICKSLDMACFVARGAIDMAKRSLEVRGEEISSEINGVLEELQRNVNIWMAKIAVDATTLNP